MIDNAYSQSTVHHSVLKEAKTFLEIEIDAIRRVKDLLDENFEKAVNLLCNCRGKVVVTGMGKSGIISKKIAATMSSTGTLAVFLHPAEGIHGDLGIVTANDVVLALSKSGETEEILALLPSIKEIGAKIISLVGNIHSTLAKESDAVINANVEREACTLNLVPTASTTVAMVLGDALAISLLKKRGFKPKDFAVYHPGGILGKRLLLKVKGLMHTGDENPILQEDTNMSDVIVALTEKKMGGVSIVDNHGYLQGIITDGDLRRALKHKERFFGLKAKDIMTKNPAVTVPEAKAIEALELMENRQSQIMVLPVVDAEKKVVGILRLHDIARVGLYTQRE
ncbi:MAG: KpsF/GutQ family sugar-phosphate isomerase [Candidatus Brocadiales bacterium]